MPEVSKLSPLCALWLLLGAPVHAQAPDASAQTLDTASIAHPRPGEWPSYGLSYQEQRYSPLTKIDRSNVSSLGLAWYQDADYARGVESTPIVVDGVMYVTGSWSVVYALDARTGKLLWKFDPQVPKQVGASACCDVVNRGVAVYQGKVFFGALDTRLFALDAKSGSVIWQVTTADRSKGEYTVTGAPRVANGRLFIGNGGAEFGVRGYVSAYSVDTGELLWRFYTVPGNPADGFANDTEAMAAKTWTGKWWELGGGGTVWDSIVYDPELDRLYIGTGNGSPWDRSVRSPKGGDNLFLSSIVALDPATGKYLWHYQETPAETWDYTATQHIMLADMQWQGRTHKVIWHAPKNGFFFVIDREDGKLLSAEPFSRVTWATGYDLQTGRPKLNPKADWTQTKEAVYVQPGHGGAHNWHPMAYSPRTGLVYIPEQEYPIAFQKRDFEGVRKGAYALGTFVTNETPDGELFLTAMMSELFRSYLTAWNPQTQKVEFRVRHPYIGSGGILATAGDLVFQGVEGDLALVAFDAKTGDELWKYNTQETPVAPPISYELDGEQYIAVAVGRGGVVGMMTPHDDGPMPANGRFMAFKLGAKASLPAPTLELSYGDPPAPDTQDKKVLAEGEVLFREHCLRCHEAKGASNRHIPDLRRLPRAMYDGFDGIVRGGMAQTLGMPQFDHVLNAEQTAKIKSYLLVEAQRDRELRAQPAFWVNMKLHGYRLLARVLRALM